MRAKEYFAYRYFLINKNQLSLHSREQKEDTLCRLKDVLSKQKKIKRSYRGKDYILYPKNWGDIFLCKFSKEKSLTKHVEGDLDIKENVEEDYPFVYIIIDTISQAVLIQKNTSVFSKVETTKNRLTAILNEIIDSHSFTIMCDSISDKNQFWNAVETSTKIFKLELCLKAPNLFGASVKANEYMEERKRELNINKMKVELDNDIGELKITRDNMDDFIEYAAEGGGHYILDYSDGQRRKKLSSSNNSKVIVLPSELDEVDYPRIVEEMKQFEINKTDNE